MAPTRQPVPATRRTGLTHLLKRGESGFHLAAQLGALGPQCLIVPGHLSALGLYGGHALVGTLTYGATLVEQRRLPPPCVPRDAGREAVVAPSQTDQKVVERADLRWR